jgi:hypothetical protein
MLSVKPLSYAEMMDSLSVSTGHLNYFIGSLGELISKHPEGKYWLSTLGVAALNLLREVEEPPSMSSSNRKETKLFVSYSVIACIVLLSLGAYCLTYAKWNLTP